MQKILFILWAAKDFGGLERRYIRLANHLYSKPQYDVSIVCQTRCRTSALKYIDNENILRTSTKTVFFGYELPYFIYRFFELFYILREINRSNTDSIVCCFNPGIITAIMGTISGRGKTFIVPNALLITDLPLRFLDIIGIKATLAKCPVIDHLSEEPAFVLKSLVPGLYPKCINKFAPVSFSDYSNVQKANCRDIDVLMIARFIEGKGYDLLESIGPFLENYIVHCCGFGHMKIKIPNARIYQSDDPFSVCARAKIFLSIQESNNYPSQSLIEAMASGCAIIATDVGETRKLITDDCGWLIPYDPVALENTISYALNNPELCETYGRRAQEYVLKKFTVGNYSDYFCREVLYWNG